MTSRFMLTVIIASVLAIDFATGFSRLNVESNPNAEENRLSSFFEGKLLSETAVDDSVKKNVARLYTFGNQTSGEYKVDAWNNDIYHDAIEDDGYCIFYGHKISYAKFFIQQTSELGSAYIFAGGIGNDFVVFCIQANQTLHFRAYAEIYSREQPRGKFSLKFLPLFKPQ